MWLRVRQSAGYLRQLDVLHHGASGGSPNTVISINKDGKTVIGRQWYPEGDVKIAAYEEPTHWELLPPSMRVPAGAWRIAYIPNSRVHQLYRRGSLADG